MIESISIKDVEHRDCASGLEAHPNWVSVEIAEGILVVSDMRSPEGMQG